MLKGLSLRTADRLLGRCEAELGAAEPEAFLNECARQGVEIGNTVSIDAFTLRFTVPEPWLPEAERAAEKCGGELTVLRRRGGKETLRRLRRRRGFLLGLAAVTALLFLSSLYIWEIDVTENPTELPDELILGTLERIGVGRGAFWPSLTADMVRSRALALLPELSFLTVNVHGSRAEVLVRGRVPAPDPVAEREPCDVYAARGGVITELRVLEGEAVKHAGDTVLPGEMLVSSLRGSTTGGERRVHARAEVTARTWYEKTAVTPFSAWSRRAVGAKKRSWGLILGKRTLFFARDSSISGDDCDTITSVFPLAVKNTFTLPLALLRRESTAAERCALRAEDEGVFQRMEDALSGWLREQLGAEGEIGSVRFTRVRGEDGWYVTMRAECTERIDTERPYPSENSVF